VPLHGRVDVWVEHCASLALFPRLGDCLAFTLTLFSAKQAARVVKHPGRLHFGPTFMRAHQEIHR
jgi:hypothetical protein